MRKLLEAQAGADGVGATHGRRRLEGVVDGDARLAVILGERHVDRSTGADAVVGGGCVAVPEARLHDVATTELEHLEHTVLDADDVVIAQEGVGGEGSRQGEALVPLVEEEVVGETDVEAGGKLHLGRASLDGEVVAGGVDHLQREAGAAELHRGAPVLEGDAELEFVILTGDILDTGVDAQSRATDVVCALGDDFEEDRAVDGVGEAVGIGHVDIHVAGRECAVAALGTEVGGDIDVAEAHRHHIEACHAALEDADSETEGVDGGSAAEAALAAIEHRVGIAHFDTLDKGETCHIGEHGVEATHIGHVDATPTGVARPRIDEQLGSTGCATTFVIASIYRL